MENVYIYRERKKKHSLRVRGGVYLMGAGTQEEEDGVYVGAVIPD